VRGLPWQSKDEDLTGFFAEVGIYPQKLHRNAGAGEAFVEFASPADLGVAMQRNKQYMKGTNRYIELIPVPYAELAATIGLSGAAPPQQGGYEQHTAAAYGGGYGGPQGYGGPPPQQPYGTRGGGRRIHEISPPA
jgi:hypothetical protein